MPYMYVFDAPQLSKAAYDAARAAIGWESAPPSGALAHAIAFDDSGVGARGFDFWETKEAAESYYQTRLAPALAQANAEMVEPRAVLELYNFAFDPTAQVYAVPRELTLA